MSLFAGFFRQRFHVAAFLAEDARGDVEHDEPEEKPCRWEPNNRLVRNADGQQVVASGSIFTPHPVGARDLVWPPGANPEDEGEAREVLSSVPRTHPLTGAVDHYEVTY